jgi:hypothetical protein
MEEKNAFTALYVGDQNNTSHGGVIFKFLVMYEDVDEARRVLGGCWKPDTPINVGVVPVAMKVGDGEA